jgi:hypothetical protein
MVAAIFCGSVWLAAALGAARADIQTTGLTALMLLVFVACMAVAAVGLFCSTFLHPMLAAGLASALVALPALARFRGWNLPPALFPLAEIVRIVADFKFRGPGTGAWSVAAAALVQTLFFWAASALTFARRDVTTSSE